MSKLFKNIYLLSFTVFHQNKISIQTITYLSLYECATSEQNTNPKIKKDDKNANAASTEYFQHNETHEDLKKDVKTIESIPDLRQKLDSLIKCHDELLAADNDIKKKEKNKWDETKLLQIQQIDLLLKIYAEKKSNNCMLIENLQQQSELYQLLIAARDHKIEHQNKSAPKDKQNLEICENLYENHIKNIAENDKKLNDLNYELNLLFKYLVSERNNLLKTEEKPKLKTIKKL